MKQYQENFTKYPFASDISFKFQIKTIQPCKLVRMRNMFRPVITLLERIEGNFIICALIRPKLKRKLKWKNWLLYLKKILKFIPFCQIIRLFRIDHYQCPALLFLYDRSLYSSPFYNNTPRRIYPPKCLPQGGPNWQELYNDTSFRGTVWTDFSPKNDFSWIMATSWFSFPWLANMASSWKT